MNPSSRQFQLQPGDLLFVVGLVAISLVARWRGGKFFVQQAAHE